LALAASLLGAGCVNHWPARDEGSGGSAASEEEGVIGGGAGAAAGPTGAAGAPSTLPTPQTTKCTRSSTTYPGACQTDFYWDLSKPVIDLRETYFYSPSGVRLKQQEDRYADGVIDETLLFERDSRGRLATVTALDATGTPKEQTTHSYDDRGRLVGEETVRLPSGELRVRVIFHYDEHTGRLVAEDVFRGTDQTVKPEHITIDYDAYGRSVMESKDTDGDGVVDVKTTYVYDGDVVTDRVRTILAEGTVRTWKYSYDQSCNLQVVEGFLGDSHTPFERYASSLDCWR
jgi:hypothetical protein